MASGQRLLETVRRAATPSGIMAEGLLSQKPIQKVMHCMRSLAEYFKSQQRAAYKVTQCRRHCVNEGTVSSGVALRPRPIEVQPRFQVSKKKKKNWFFISLQCHVYIDRGYQIVMLKVFEIIKWKAIIAKDIVTFISTAVTKIIVNNQ